MPIMTGHQLLDERIEIPAVEQVRVATRGAAGNCIANIARLAIVSSMRANDSAPT